MIPLRKRVRRSVDNDYICACCARYAFDWNRRRSGWRLSIFYKTLTFTTIVGNVINLGLYVLISNRDFFTNYRCGEKAMSLISVNFLALMTITGSVGIAGVLMSRVLLLFNKFPISEFMSCGKWTSRLGCIVKWVPMFMTLCFFAWFILGVVSSIWIFALPENWCSRRWGFGAIVAVKNCRMWYRAQANCIDTQEKERIDSSNEHTCNDGEQLYSNNFFWFTPKTEDSSCSFNDISVCRAYKVLFSTLVTSGSPTVDWQSSALAGCTGPLASDVPPEDFMDISGVSDLYRYLRMYIIGWNIMLLTLGLFFFYIKFSSKMASIFHLPRKPKQNIIVKLLRLFSPFDR